MANLKETLAIEVNYLKALQKNGESTLKSAQTVMKELGKYTAKANEKIAELPAGVKQTAIQNKIAKAKRDETPELYGTAANTLKKNLQELIEEVPKYDRTSGKTISDLMQVTKKLTDRIIALENMVTAGSVEKDPDTFRKEIAQCKKDWNRKSKELDTILKRIQAALNGMDVEVSKYSKDPVNLSTGNFVYDRLDMKIAGSVPLFFHRYYNSIDRKSGALGGNWKHNYEIRLQSVDNIITIWLEDGREESFFESGNGYESITGSIHTLQKTDTGYRYGEGYGKNYLFDFSGNLLVLSDANQNSIRFTYSEDNRLQQADSLSGTLYYIYNETGMLEKVQDHTGRSVLLQYKDGRLYKIITPEGADYSYTYGTDGILRSIVNPQKVMVVKNRFDKEARTKKQSFPDGGIMKFSYDDENQTVTLTERNGGETVYEHDERYRNVRTVYTDGEECWTYNQNNQKTSYTDKNGNRTVYAYDSLGNLIRIIDACGNATNITYGGHQRPVHIKTPDGAEWKFSYDNRGNLIKQVDACGNVTQLQYNEEGRPIKVIQADHSETILRYDERGNVTTVIHPDGGTLCYTYDDLNRITETADENGNTIRYVYDKADRITRVTNEEGNTRSYSYNKSGMVTEIIDFDGNKILRGYNALNKLEWKTDKEGNTTRYVYDLMWNISKVILPNAGEILYRYNELEQLECITNPLGGSLFYHYDKNGNIIRIENAQGDAVTYTYDELNKKTGETDALGNERRIYYDGMGRVVREVDAMERTFDTVYDLNGNTTAEVDISNGGMAYTYDCMGRIQTMTDGAGRVREYTYDICGRVQEIKDFDGRKVSYIYDRKGNITCKTDSTGTEYHYVYDKMNRLMEVRNGEYILQSYTYDAMGNQRSVTDANGNRTQYHYTPNGYMDQVTDPAGNVTSYVYDAMGQLEKIVYPSEEEERTIVYERNLAGQVTKVTDALGNTEIYEYDCYGRMTGKTDRNGQYTQFQYNAMGDVTHIQYADEREVYLSYDPLRQLKELQDWTGTTQFIKDEAGRTKEVIDSFGNTVAYEWGALGERKSVIYPDGQRIIYQYDPYLNLREVTVGTGKTVYAYDKNGRLSEKQHANGMRSCYTYTPEGRLESLLHMDKNGILDRFLYTYDAEGNRIAEERERRNLPDESGSYRYIYDMLGRLIAVEKDGEQIRSYEYDAYGNRIVERRKSGEIQYTYNKGNQLVTRKNESETQEYTYDANGSLLQVRSNEAVLMDYRYDSAGNMVFAKTQKGSAQYQYNGFGKKIGLEIGIAERGGDKQTERIQYILDHTKDYNNLLQRKAGKGTETYFWDGSLLSAAYVTEDYLQDQTNAEGSLTYLLDPLGSPLHLGNAAGAVTEDYGYDVFGEDIYTEKDMIADSLLCGKQPFGFTGYERDVVSGLYYAQARRYDAKNGRFTGRDIIKGNIGKLQSQNEYSYCLGNPLAYVDKDGKAPDRTDGSPGKDLKNFEDVYYLNAEDGAKGAGHAAILLVEDEGEGYYYSMAKKGKFTSYTLTSEQVNNLLEQGEIDPDSQDTDTDVDNSTEPYNRYIKKSVTDTEADKMIKEAEKHNQDSYNLVFNNCNQVATEILNAGGHNYTKKIIPNHMYDYLRKEAGWEKE